MMYYMHSAFGYAATVESKYELDLLEFNKFEKAKRAAILAAHPKIRVEYENGMYYSCSALCYVHVSTYMNFIDFVISVVDYLSDISMYFRLPNGDHKLYAALMQPLCKLSVYSPGHQKYFSLKEINPMNLDFKKMYHTEKCGWYNYVYISTGRNLPGFGVTSSTISTSCQYIIEVRTKADINAAIEKARKFIGLLPARMSYDYAVKAYSAKDNTLFSQVDERDAHNKKLEEIELEVTRTNNKFIWLLRGRKNKKYAGDEVLSLSDRPCTAAVEFRHPQLTGNKLNYRENWVGKCVINERTNTCIFCNSEYATTS